MFDLFQFEMFYVLSRMKDCEGKLKTFSFRTLHLLCVTKYHKFKIGITGNYSTGSPGFCSISCPILGLSHFVSKKSKYD